MSQYKQLLFLQKPKHHIKLGMIQVRTLTSMGYCKTAVTPVHKQWSYCSLVLTHWLDPKLKTCRKISKLMWFKNLSGIWQNCNELLAFIHHTGGLAWKCFLIKISHCSLFPRAIMATNQHWIRYWLGTKQAPITWTNDNSVPQATRN